MAFDEFHGCDLSALVDWTDKALALERRCWQMVQRMEKSVQAAKDEWIAAAMKARDFIAVCSNFGDKVVDTSVEQLERIRTAQSQELPY